MDVRMPDGTIITNVPDDITQSELQRRLNLAQAPAPTDKPAGFSAKETALALGQGIVGAGKSLTDVFGADNVVSQGLGKVQDVLGEQYSPERKAEMARREEVQKKAAQSGSLTEEISAYLGSVADAPVQSLAQGLGSIVPYIGTGIIGGIAKLGGATIKAINTVVGAAQGAGAVKGSIYDGVRNELINSGMRPEEAEAKASKAQEYLGGNFLDIAGGAALGGVGARVGVENMLTPGAAAKLDSRLLSRMGKAALAEAPLEGVQGGQEQVAINRALQQAGFDVSTFQGVGGAAARDAAIGALTGAAVGVRGGAPEAVVPPKTDEQKKAEEETKALDTGKPRDETQIIDPKIAAGLTPRFDAEGNPIAGAPPSVTTPFADETIDFEATPEIATLQAEYDKRAQEIATGTNKGKIAAQVKKNAALKTKIDELKTKVVPTTQEVVTEAPKESIYDVPKKEATNYLAELDAGKKASFPTLQKYIKALGLEIPEAGPNRNQRSIELLKSYLAQGEANAIQQADTTTGGDGTEVLGGPDTTGAAAGVTESGLGRPGVVSDQGIESAPQDGAGSQQPTLNQEVIDQQALADQEAKAAEAAKAATAATRYSNVSYVDPDTNEPTTLNFDEAFVEDGVIYVPSNGEFDYPIDYLNLGEKGPEAAALEKTLLDRFASELQAKTEEQVIAEEAATELAGEVAPPVKEVAAEIKPPVEEKKPVPLVIEAEQDASTPEAQTKRDDVVAKVNAFEDIRKLLESREKDEKGQEKAGTGIESFDKKAKVAGPKGEVIKEAKVAKPIKWRGKKGTKTKNPSPYNFLNENGYYSDKSPEQIAEQSKAIAAKDKKAKVKDAIEAGVESAAFDEAYDLYDSIAYEEKVLPEIKAVMAERQAAKNAEIDAANQQRETNRKAKEAQLIDEGKSPKVIKEALSVIKKAPKVIYLETKPFEFMSEQEVLELFKKNIGTKTQQQMVDDEGGQARIDSAKNRNAFVEVLSPVDKIKFSMMAEAILDIEIISAVQDNKVTTAGDRRTEANRRKQEQAIIDDVKEQLKQAELSTEEREKKEQAKAARIAEKAEARQREAQEIKTKTEVAKNRYTAKIETAIAKGEAVDAKKEPVKGPKVGIVLTAIQSDERGQIGNMAKQLNKLLKDLGLESKAKITFGKVEGDADGKFDPANGNITIKGEKGVYTGKRNLAETVVHEVMHYLTDHVVDNRKEYLASIKDPAKRKQVNDALNRLDNNYKLVKAKFGKKYNIGTMKEFIAEMYSNPALQADVAMLPPTKEYQGNFFKTIVNNIATALGFTRSGQNEAVEFREIIEDIASILSLPATKGKKGFRGTEVSYSEEKKKEPTFRTATFNNPGSEYKPSEALAPKNWRWFKERFFTRPGWRKIAYEFQNDRYYVKLWEDSLQVAGLIKHGLTEKFNNIYTQLTLATSAASNLYKKYLAGTVDELDSSIMEYAKAAGISTDEVLAKLHVLFEALHEPERRLVKYLMNVPLRDVADNRRKEILDLIRANNKLTKAEAKQLRDELEAIVRNPKNLDPASKKPTDMNHADYNVLGIDINSAAQSREEYEADPNKELIDNILGKVKDLNTATAELNKMANYWSQPVTNIVNFYGWDFYTPFKGPKYLRPGVTDELLDFDSARNGKELQEVAYAFEGSTQLAENPVLQVLADASRAAARAGRKDLTQSILNAITPNAEGKKLLQGSVVQTIKFEDRYNIKDILANVKRENTVFHYNADGSIDVIEINDRQLRESIRRTYKDSNPMVDIANTVTSKLGQLHTRYNYNFAPMNFVRDALTNAWTIGADMGPAKTARYIQAIVGSVVSGGLTNRARKIAYMLQKNDIEGIEKLKNVRGYEEMADYVLNSGMVSYLQSLTTKSNFDEIQKRLGKNKIAKTKDQLDAIVDTWTDMFEIASRAAAFGVAKKAAMDENIANGMSPKDAEEAANIRAAGYAKNLANFEQVGEYGKAMGAFYMFFRPSATGAVRAIEAVAPAFPGSLKRALSDLPPHIQQPDPKDLESVKALADFKANYAQKQQNARIMVSALMGMGMLAYTMSAMMADDDDLGRNKLMTDNMDQWTRFWRIHVPGSSTPIQIPWGFGLGSFAAAGAQFASVASGHQSAGKALANVFLQVSLDSFVPIPVSRMPPADNPLAFAVDSIAPSTVRPVIEFLINKNGLGQDIYNSATGRRMGDAFLGGDRIPEMYKNAAAALWNATNGAIDISPNTMYFLANSYADGVSKLFEGTFGITDTISGRKEFSAKTDIPLFGSFFGAEANVDSREFASVEKQILEKAKRVEAAKLNPDRYVRYSTSNPFDEMLVDSYNKDVADLNELRKYTKQIRVNDELSPKEKQEFIKIYNYQQNLIKRNLIEQYKAYGIEP